MRRFEGKLKSELVYSLTIFKVSDDEGFLYYDITNVNPKTNQVEYKSIYTLEALQDFIRGLI